MDAELETALRQGPQSAADLRSRLGVSQPTLSRTLGRARGNVALLGRGRSTKYGLYRRIRDLAPEHSVHRICVAGEAARIGTLITIAPDRYWYDDLEHSEVSAEHYSIPWFATDMRPQGYLGRYFPRTYTELNLPERITDWSEDQGLYAIARRGEDAVGNLIIGDESLARWVAMPREPSFIRVTERASRYLTLADEAVAGRAAGSYAAGEQPKFTALVGNSLATSRHVIVKFSSPLDSATGARWSDLLLAEHLASVVLLECGHAAARSEFLSSGARAFLEVERFDRVAHRGRRGLISLGALDDEFVGERRGWPESAAALLRARLISADDARELRFLSAFGALIANNDMHLGNASFLTEAHMELRLAPAYDMLPMLYAPVRDEVVSRIYDLPTPTPGHADQWHAAIPVAREFWERLAEDARASGRFRETARVNAELLK